MTVWLQFASPLMIPPRRMVSPSARIIQIIVLLFRQMRSVRWKRIMILTVNWTVVTQFEMWLERLALNWFYGNINVVLLQSGYKDQCNVVSSLCMLIPYLLLFHVTTTSLPSLSLCPWQEWQAGLLSQAVVLFCCQFDLQYTFVKYSLKVFVSHLLIDKGRTSLKLPHFSSY